MHRWLILCHFGPFGGDWVMRCGQLLDCRSDCVLHLYCWLLFSDLGNDVFELWCWQILGVFSNSLFELFYWNFSSIHGDNLMHGMYCRIILLNDGTFGCYRCLRSWILFCCVSFFVHELRDWLFSSNDECNILFSMYRRSLLCNDRSLRSYWRMRSWKVLGHRCIRLLELLRRHLLSFIVIIVMLELLSRSVLRCYRDKCMHSVYSGVILRHHWPHSSHRGLRCGHVLSCFRDSVHEL